MRGTEIRSLKIDLDKDVLEINGKQIKDQSVIVVLPGPEGWPLSKLFNARSTVENLKEHDVLKVTYEVDGVILACIGPEYFNRTDPSGSGG